MDKAKAIREERKGGIRDEAHTFKPQINARPSYLDDTPQHDALDDLAANYDTNDIFEKPLPGKKSYGLDPSAAPTYGNMSPGSDALGTEMRKHSPRNSCSNIYQSNSRQSSGSNMKESSYQDTASSYSKASDSEATESFMNNLRSDGSFKSKSKKPGWNEDFTSAGVIDSYSRPPAVPIVKKTAVESTISPRNNLRPPVNAASKSTSQRGISSRSEWDNDFTTHQSDRMNDLPPQPSQQKLSPNSEQAKVITHARSRLSLLKSKIRQSESSGSARFSETYSSDENADDTPRTAPITRNNSSSFSNKQEMPSQTSQYMKKPNQSLQMQDESMNRGRMGANEGRVGNSRTNSQATIDTSISPMSGTPRRSAGGGYSSFNDVPSNIEIDRDRGHLPPRVSKETSSFSMANDSPDMEEDIIIGEQVECPDCGRKFNPSSFQKHAKICAKVFLQKRKVFDSKKMRVADNPELVKIIKKVEKEGKSKKNTKPSEGNIFIPCNELTVLMVTRN